MTRKPPLDLPLMRWFAWLPRPAARPLIAAYRALPARLKRPCARTPTCSAYAMAYGIPAAIARTGLDKFPPDRFSDSC